MYDQLSTFVCQAQETGFFHMEVLSLCTRGTKAGNPEALGQSDTSHLPQRNTRVAACIHAWEADRLSENGARFTGKVCHKARATKTWLQRHYNASNSNIYYIILHASMLVDTSCCGSSLWNIHIQVTANSTWQCPCVNSPPRGPFLFRIPWSSFRKLGSYPKNNEIFSLQT